MRFAMLGKSIYSIVALALILTASICDKAAAQGAGGKDALGTQAKAKPLVTFIELGSVNCIPCKAMRPVMTDIETSYGGKVQVLFYDVWTKEGEPYGRQYGIRVIPTQVFLDRNGREFYRHEGFFLASDIKKLLKEHGIAP
jgi:thioredoxin 1